MRLQNLLCRFFTLYLGTILLVTCQFVPVSRHLQTSAIINNSRWYFFGGRIRNHGVDSDDISDINDINEVFYLKLSKSFSTDSLEWHKDETGSPLANVFSTSYVYPNNSSILIIGGVMANQTTHDVLPNSSAIYKYNLNDSSWEVPKITGIDDFAHCGGLQSMADNTGRIFLYGGMLDIPGPICNKMSILYTNNMSWITNNITTSRFGYAATIDKSGNITYIGGRSMSNFDDDSYVSMNEILIFDTKSLSWHNIVSNSRLTGESLVLLNKHVYIFDTLNYKWVKTLERDTPVPPLIIVLPILAFLLVLLMICWCLKRQRKQNEGLSS
ncbi:1557_t:CDS:2 [Dentiscutata erythropus]|uniref:1557_t:CDS:1 n=1 Tax=Dentiscutata erythropus TaxID=1348616 RepID=A0A9N8V706_9GLOM|nr:1557_t:CDS:2 [Dentiscutata erythropus]